MSGTDHLFGVQIRHLAALQAIAEEGTFGRAAKRLGYTQSAVSQQIAALERAVGQRLIDRPGGPRPVALTEAGRLVLQHARAILARLDAARADLDALAAGGSGLCVGVFQSVGARVLPLVMRRFSERWPSIDVKLVEDEDESLISRVERGEVDLAFVVPPIDGPFEALELLRDPHFLVVSKESELADRSGPLPLQALSAVPMLVFQPTGNAQRRLEEELLSRGVILDVTFRSNDNRVIQGFVEEGIGCAIMPGLSIEPSDEIALVETDPALPPRCISVIWHRDRYQSPAARAFVEEALRVGKELSVAADALSAA